MLTIFIFLTILFFLLSSFFAYKAYNFSLIILNIEDQIEESLEILQERYDSMGKILEKEVFFDSVEVRQVINDIKICHQSILVIADKLTQNFLEENEIKKENLPIEDKENQE